MGIKFSLLSLAKLLLCELWRKYRREVLRSKPFITHPGSWLPFSRLRGWVSQD